MYELKRISVDLTNLCWQWGRLVILLALIPHLGSSQAITPLPNIIVILADDLGYGDVSIYNEQAAFQTPNIDRLAASGMRFTDAHTSSSICTPTRYGLLTGRYNWRSRLKRGGFNGYSKPLIDPDRITMPELLQSAGYHTSMIGKWHLGWDWHSTSKGIDFSEPIENGPQKHGFDYSYALAASLSSPPYVYVENGQPTAIPIDSSVNYDEKAFWRKGPKAADFAHVDVLETITERAVAHINQRTGEGQPFFLYCAFTAPHAPIIPKSEYIGKSNTNAYGDFVLMVDDMVGRLVDAVWANEIQENTLIVFLSDNGQSPRADFEDDELTLAGHRGNYIFRGKKFDIYEGGHRVPFIASWRNKIEAGTTSSETICSVDLMATVADLIGVDLPDNVGEDSYSLLPLFLKPEDESSYQRDATVHHSSEGRFAIRQGDWKLILWPGSGGWTYPKTSEEMEGLPAYQLFNLREDPGEEINRVADHPEIVTDLMTLLKTYIKNGRSTPGDPQKNEGPHPWPELAWMDK